MNGDARSRRADPPRGSRWAGAGGRERAAGYLRADHVELAIVLQLELDRLLPEGLAQRHHHHCGGGGGAARAGLRGIGRTEEEPGRAELRRTEAGRRQAGRYRVRAAAGVLSRRRRRRPGRPQCACAGR